MSPFGSISLRETALAGYRPHLLGLPRKSGRGISLRETTLCGCPLRGHGFATPHRYFAVPVTAAPRRGPNGKNPALVGLHSPSISLRETALAGHRPHRGRYFAVPVTAAPRRGPNGKTPALVAVRLHFAARNRAGRSLPPPGATCSLPHFRFAQMWPRIFPRGLPGYVPLFHGWPRARTPALAPVRSHFAPRNRAAGHRPHRGRCFGLPRFRFAQARSPGQNPGPPRFQLGFCCAKTGGRVPPLSDGGALTKSENIILCASSCHPPRSPYPHCTLPRVRFSGIGQKKKPQRKTAAAVNTLYMSCKKTSVNPISFPVALCTKISPFKAIHLLSQCKTKIQFLWMRMRKRSAN